MRLIILCLTLLFAATTIVAAAPSETPQGGSWVCLPDDQTAPQVLVDLEENIYRRCDQSTCASYNILGVQRHPKATQISFAPGAIMRVADDGSRYTEILDAGGAAITSSGTCTQRVSEPDTAKVNKIKPPN